MKPGDRPFPPEAAEAEAGASGAPSAQARIGICVATFQRPILLKALLDSLAALAFPRMAGAAPFVVVVDNDAEGSARQLVETWAAHAPFPVHYEIEPRRGIPHVRNSGVRLALGLGADFLAFIDDDEVATPTWLDELLHVQARSGADVVSGPSLPSYEPGVPDWVVEGGFFTYPRYSTGSEIPVAATNNVLVSRHCFEGRAEPFDPAFGLSGMDDSQFFLRLRHEGRSLVWADEAIVREHIPRTRARAGWILQRAFRIGNGYVFCARSLEPAYRWVPVRLTGALARIAAGTLLLPLSVFRGRAATVQALRTMSNGAGSLVALAGRRYMEYTVVHGR